MKLKKIVTSVLALALVFALAACGDGKTNTETDLQKLSLDELEAKIDLRFQEINTIIDGHAELWDKLFAQDDDTVNQIFEGSIISEYMTALLEKHKDLLSDAERKALEDDIKRIRGIEAELDRLEEAYSKRTEGNGISQDSPTPEHFPSFEGRDLDGNAVDDKSLFAANSVTVVNFWFSGCSPCVEELDELNALNEQLKERGGAVIGINTDTLDGNPEMIDEAKKILEQKGAAYQNIWFARDSEAGMFSGEILGFPTTYVVDSEGRIVGQPIMGSINYPGILELLQVQINQALGEEAVDY